MTKCGIPECINEPEPNRILCKEHEAKDLKRTVKYGELRKCGQCRIWFRSKSSEYCSTHEQKTGT